MVLLCSDEHSQGYTNHIVRRVKFIIYGLKKPEGLYSKGMKPCICEYTENCLDDWAHGGYDIEYQRPEINRCFSLQFSYDFLHENSITFFAYCFPYTYSRLQQFIYDITEGESKLVKTQNIHTTRHGNFITRHEAYHNQNN